MTKMDEQIGGSHYTDMGIQPLEYSMANKLNACEHSVVKYVSRHRGKGGKEDLLKAIDMLEKLIEFEYGHHPLLRSKEEEDQYGEAMEYKFGFDYE